MGLESEVVSKRNTFCGTSDASIILRPRFYTNCRNLELFAVMTYNEKYHVGDTERENRQHSVLLRG